MGAQIYSLTLALHGVGGQHHAQAALPPGMRAGTYRRDGWDPGARLEVLKKKNNFVSVGIRTPPTVQPVASP